MNRKTLLLTLYKKAYLIRAAEELIVKHYDANEMKTPMHMSMGEEGIISGVCTSLGSESLTFGTYRSHGLYLAVTDETDKFFAEMYGKATGVLRGKGGSMHILAPDKGLLGISAVVASTIPVAVGAAFGNAFCKNNKITAVFFGDGAVDEGVFWESLNLACLKKLPVLFICEDNEYAVHTHRLLRRGYKKLTDIIKKFSCTVFESTSTDAEEIYRTTNKAIGSIRKKGQPAFLQLSYYRYLEHVGVHEDFNAGYRDRKGLIMWQKKDPLAVLKNKLKKLTMTDREIVKYERSIDKQVEISFQKALAAPPPDPKSLLINTYYETP